MQPEKENQQDRLDTLKNEDIVCIGPGTWDEPCWRRRQHITSRLAAANRVLYVESAISLFTPFREMSNFKRLFRILRSVRKIQNNLYACQLFNVLPFSRVDLFKRINYRINCWFIKLILFLLKMKSPILWIYFNSNRYTFIDSFHQKLICYDCYDKYVEFYIDRKAKQRAEEWENQILSKANIVFAVSERLCADLRRYNQNVHFSPNGVDLGIFSPSNYEKGIHPKLLRIRKPILAYSGSFKSKVDLDLLAFISEKLPDCSLVLMGALESDDEEWIKKFKQLTERENVFYVGVMKREELPSCFNAVDVFLLPLSTHGTNYYASNPNKLNEYLTTGRPIVAYDPQNRYGELEEIRCGKSYEEVVSNIRDSLLRPDNLAERRKEIAEKHSWDKIVTNMMEIIKRELERQRS